MRRSKKSSASRFAEQYVTSYKAGDLSTAQHIRHQAEAKLNDAALDRFYDIINEPKNMEISPEHEKLRTALRNPDYVSFGRKGRGEVFHAFTSGGAKRKAQKIADKSGKEQWVMTLKELEAIERAQKRKNPAAGPSAIPARWTPATVSRKGGQIQIRMGGRHAV